MLDYDMKVSQQARETGDGDAAILKSHGFTGENIWGIAAVPDFFGMSGRLANATAMRRMTRFSPWKDEDPPSISGAGGRGRYPG